MFLHEDEIPQPNAPIFLDVLSHTFPFMSAGGAIGAKLIPGTFSLSFSLYVPVDVNQSCVEPPVSEPSSSSREFEPLVKISWSIRPSLYHLAISLIACYIQVNTCRA